MIVDPWGEVLARAPGDGEASWPPTSTSSAWTRSARSCRAWPTACRAPTAGRRRRTPDGRPRAPERVDKRRLILDAAIRVFARRGFHHCRVSDVADEAGVAYGLVYHYFDSKEEILNTLFAERWQLMLDAIAEIDAPATCPRATSCTWSRRFIIDSYRHEPDLMKVIIVEVTRAANSFGAGA